MQILVQCLQVNNIRFYARNEGPQGNARGSKEKLRKNNNNENKCKKKIHVKLVLKKYFF